VEQTKNVHVLTNISKRMNGGEKTNSIILDIEYNKMTTDEIWKTKPRVIQVLQKERILYNLNLFLLWLK
jgi:hypothetical protein